MNPAAMTERLIDAAIYNEQASGAYAAGAQKELNEARAVIERALSARPYGEVMDELDHAYRLEQETPEGCAVKKGERAMTYARREEQLRIQAVGAAISRRDWHAVEQAYNAIRDEFDRRPCDARNALGREWLKTEIDAIDTWYRGDPSYLRDAYWMKEQVLRLLDHPGALSQSTSGRVGE